MKKALELDMTDLSDILEGFVKKLEKMSEADLIDMAARLKPVAKHCQAIDEFVKGMVKDKLGGAEGSRNGSLFKAVLKLVPVHRLNQGRFKETKPALHESFCDDVEDKRITFEAR